MSKNPKTEKVVTRFAPSPTGFLHVGGVRTALFAYLFAKQNEGKMILRIEDTDKERNKKEYEENIVQDLAWLGLKEDEFYRQSDRLEIYKKYLNKLTKEDKAYLSKETPTEAEKKSEVIRFKNPNKKVLFNDLVRGDVEMDTSDLGDFVIAKSIDEPLYHLAVVVDDSEMGVTHIIRAEEHLSNTPRQILIQEALGFSRPIYAHLPLVLAPDRTKLSKRKHGETVSLTYYKNKGYLPEAIVNFLALLGWNPGTDQEILSMDELLQKFSLDKVQKGGAIFNEEKLRWVNKEYLKKLPKEKQAEEIKKRIVSSEKYKEKKWQLDDSFFSKILPIILDRIEVWNDVTEMITHGELDYFFEAPDFSAKSLLWKGEGTTEQTKAHLEKVISFLEEISADQFSAEKIKSVIWDYASSAGRGNVLWPMRFALSGKDKSPDPFVLSEIFGKEKTIDRLKNAILKL